MSDVASKPSKDMMVQTSPEQALRSKTELGRKLAHLAALILIASSLLSNGIGMWSVDFDAIILQLLLSGGELTISGFLCWGLYRGKPWARTLVLIRTGLSLVILGSENVSDPLTQTLLPNLAFDLLSIPLSVAMLLLAFGPGVASFFALESKLEAERTHFLEDVEARNAGPIQAAFTPSELQSTVGLIRQFANAIESSGLEEFYCGHLGGLADDIARALHRIGATQSAALMDQANLLFGDAGPPKNDEERIGALEALSSAKASALGRFELELDRHGEDLMALLFEYAGGDPESLGDTGDWSSNA